FGDNNSSLNPYQITEQRILIRYTWLSGAVKLHTFQLFFWQSSVAKGIWILSNSTISFHSATSLIIGGKSATFSSIVAIANFVKVLGEFISAEMQKFNPGEDFISNKFELSCFFSELICIFH
ncbi:Protein of unknown function, partial [Cotesia congregata]